MNTREEAAAGIHLLAVPEWRDAPPGTAGRKQGYSDAGYARRARAFDTRSSAR